MNKLCYRIVFNRARQMLIVVSELARSAGGTAPRGSGGSVMRRYLTLCPLALAVWCAAGWVSMPANASTVITDRNAPGSQRPTVLETNNGIPQINIRKPDGHGLSHNKYTRFDIDPRGAVLNNSQQSTTTQLAGSIAGNPWLAKGSARVILNEVTGRAPSQLNGFIEVAGHKADVIIASPAGITCNGCGFINAASSTLVAGRPAFSDGQLAGFNVSNGEIAIEGRGLNGNHQQYTRLIARAVKVNARIQARDLQVSTKNNSGEDSDGKPHFSLDVSALGGMYAGKISLTGTEKGVGVHNAGEIGAFQGNLQLSVDGKLTNKGTIYARENLALQTTGLDNRGLLGSDASIQITNQGDMVNSGRLQSAATTTLHNRGNLRHHAGGQIVAGKDMLVTTRQFQGEHNSTVAAGIDSAGAATQPGSVSLSASGHLQSYGEHRSLSGLHLRGDSVDVRGSRSQADTVSLSAVQGDIIADEALISAQTFTATTPGMFFNRQGQLDASLIHLSAAGGINNAGGTITQSGRDELWLVSPHLDNRDGVLTSGGNLKLTASTLINQRGTLGSHKGDVHIDAENLAGAGGAIIAARALQISGGDIVLSEGFSRGQAINLTAGRLDNQRGKILQTGNTDAQLQVRDTLNNRLGAIVSLGGLSINGQTIENQQGVLSAISGTLALLAGDTLNNQSGHIASDMALTLTGENIDNARGVIQSAAGGLIQARQLDNAGGKLLATRGPLVARITGPAGNQNGVMASGGRLALQASTVNNNGGLIQSADALIIDTGAGGLSNANTLTTNTGIRAGGALDLRSGDTDNRDGLIGAETIMTRSGRWNNQQGEVISRQNLVLNASAFTNQSGLVSAQKGVMTISLSAELNNQSGVLQSGNAMQVMADSVDNRNGTLMAAGGSLVFNSRGLFSNQQGKVAAYNSVQVTAWALDNQDGNITALQGGGEFTLEQGLHNLRGHLAAGRTLTVSAGELNNRQGQVMAAAGDITLRLTQGLQNMKGEISSRGDARLRAAMLDNSGGTIFSRAGRIQGQFSGPLVNQHGVIESHSTAELTAGNVDNRGGTMLSAGESLMLTATDDLQNQGGFITALSGIRLLAGALDNHRGVIQNRKGDARLGINGSVNNQQGHIIGGQGLSFSAGVTDNRQGIILGESLQISSLQLDNRKGLLQGGRQLSIDTRGHTLQNNTSETPDTGIRSGGALMLRGGDVANQQGIITSIGELALTARQLDNTKGMVHSNSRASVLVDPLAGILNNAEGRIQSNEDLNISSARFINHNGQLTAVRDLQIHAVQMANQHGVVIAVRDGLLAITRTLQNTGGFIRAGEALALHSPLIENQETREQGQGIEAGALLISAGQFDNTHGALRASESLGTEAQALNNTRGLIWSQGTLRLGQETDPELLLTNRQGDIASGGDMALLLRGLNAAGRITSVASIALKITGALVQDGTLAAGKNLEINSADLTNHGLINAGQGLTLNSGILVNQQGAEISAGQASISASRLVNYGLLDGDLVTLRTPSLHNSGSGRIYGDDVVIDARQVLNDASDEVAATIAGRRSVTIATDLLRNLQHGLIYSDGSLVLGKTHHDDGSITGQAERVENHSATLEAAGVIVLSAETVDNRDINLAVTGQPQPLGVSDWIEEFQYCAGDRERASCNGGDGRRYVIEADWKNGERRALNPDGTLLNDGHTKLRLESGKNIRRQRFFLPGFEPSKHFYQYRYQVHTAETRVLHRDPALIRSGSDLMMHGDLHNENSAVVAGRHLAIEGQANNVEAQGLRVTTR